MTIVSTGECPSIPEQTIIYLYNHPTIMNAEDLSRWGIPAGDPMRVAFKIIKQLINETVPPETVRAEILSVIHEPAKFRDHPHWAPLAELLDGSRYKPRSEPAPYQQWGDDLEEQSIEQMKNACQLPVAVRGALMPDAHVGYGLPIGGVLATDNAVIPYAVGVDIACRMKMTVLDLPAHKIDKTKMEERLVRALSHETLFGTGKAFNKRSEERRRHAVMDRDWSVSPITRDNKDKAWAQLGTSGSGNHFAEFGLLEVGDAELGLEPGTYIALLSHSGSRGTGAAVAAHYSKLACQSHPELPHKLAHLAWLDMDTDAGQEYWAAMNLMGEYAAANHACIHRHVANHLGAEVLLDLENHHNFAWKEEHDGRTVYVHRKGATPAGKGVIGIIPGSMATAAYVVRGKGKPESLNSASHGAGRVMSRTKAKQKLRWSDAKELLNRNKVRLLSAGLDEVPMVYKDIEAVMDAQDDLVERLARFQPRIVKMAPAGERPED